MEITSPQMTDRRTLSVVLTFFLTLFFLSFLAGFLLGPLRDSDLNPNFRCYGQNPAQCQ